MKSTIYCWVPLGNPHMLFTNVVFSTWGLGQKHWKVHPVAANILKPTLSLVGFGEISGTLNPPTKKDAAIGKCKENIIRPAENEMWKMPVFFVYHLVI